jgi:4-hydroxybenzoate polyprenyltransferase
MGIISFFLAILYSASVGSITVIVILFIMGNYFLYSSPPLRLKRIPIFSKLFISLNSLMVLLLGFYFVTDSTNMPYEIIVPFIIGFTILINFIDIKDYEGDKRYGILTIPTMLGLNESKTFFAVIFLIGYIGFGILLNNPFIMFFLIIIGIVQFILIRTKNYHESYVMVLYLVTLLFVIFFINIQAVKLPGF